MSSVDVSLESSPVVLATDLDGTLIPLPGQDGQRRSLALLVDALCKCDILLIYVTGRHFESVQEARIVHGLPAPNWIISDVGTGIYCRDDAGDFQPLSIYREHLLALTGGLDRMALELKLANELPNGLIRQPDAHQRDFKLSFYVDSLALQETSDVLDALLAALDLPWGSLASIDPFTHRGLIDILPARVDKAHAIEWLTAWLGLPREQVVFAGDSGNDRAALVAGFRAILVGNANPGLVAEVVAAHREYRFQDRLYLAKGHATEGVLEGCRHFGLFA